MKLLVIGGAGYVASLILPILAQQHTLRIFDLRPPNSQELSNVDFVEGNVCDFEVVGSEFESQQS